MFLGTDPDRIPTELNFQAFNQAPNHYANPAIWIAQRCRHGVLAEALEAWKSL